MFPFVLALARESGLSAQQTDLGDYLWALQDHQYTSRVTAVKVIIDIVLNIRIFVLKI